MFLCVDMNMFRGKKTERTSCNLKVVNCVFIGYIMFLCHDMNMFGGSRSVWLVLSQIETNAYSKCGSFRDVGI